MFPLYCAWSGPFLPIDELQMKPRFMMAEVVEEWKRRHVCSLSRIAGSQSLEKTKDFSPIVRVGSRSPQWEDAKRRKQSSQKLLR